MSAPQIDLAARLRDIPAFADLPEDGLSWFMSNMNVNEYSAGEIISREGTPAEHLIVVLEGEIRGRHESSPDDGRVYNAYAGQITGMLPYSRLKSFPLTTRAAATPTVLAVFPAALFPEMIQRIPALAGRLVNVMADRVREVTRADQEREKLAALGKLSAGLAHELNNPAAAARRAADDLREAVQALRTANARLDSRDLPTAARAFLAQLECDWNRGGTAVLDALARSDREDEIARWLETHGVPEAWKAAGPLVEAGCDAKTLDELGARFTNGALTDAVARLSASFTITRLAGEISSSTARISELVRAIKEYSYMDQMPEQEVDIHQGIDNTLIMLKHRLKKGVSVVREYGNNVPRVCVHGSELNQVWTNLIENAIDAMNGKGELRIRTAREGDRVLVELRDNGAGIPPEIRDHIFEPFFTTKGVGQGTGLGLDTVYRIVRRHHGEITVQSRPGDTRFQVLLPVPKEHQGGKQ
ncbi:MAG TPA: ATP-binding protein [Bryobacteraceae bacterium]|nr:ATP-binding protein [Bryobacteraceae bacterium]